MKSKHNRTDVVCLLPWDGSGGGWRGHLAAARLTPHRTNAKPGWVVMTTLTPAANTLSPFATGQHMLVVASISRGQRCGL
jgi:hypothetical protein